MRFWLGLAIGVVVGAVAMYLGLAQPWRSSAKPATVVAVQDGSGSGSGSGSGTGKRKKGHRRGGGGGGGGEPGAGDEVDTEETEPIVLTDADRRLEWKGDEVSLPPKVIDMEGTSEARALDSGEITDTVNRRGDGVIRCIQQAAAGTTDLAATVTLKLAVDGNGRVGKVKVQAPHYLFTQGLLSCARKAAARFDFPATGAGTLVTAPFEVGP